jgi:uncharacterized protein
MSLFKEKSPAAQLLLFIGMVLLCFGFALTLIFISRSIVPGLPEVLNGKLTKEGLFAQKFIMLVQQFGLFILPAVIFSFMVSKKPIDYLGLKKPIVAWQWVIGAVILIVSVPLASALGYLNLKLVPASLIEQSKTYKVQMDLLVNDMIANKNPYTMLFISGIMAGVSEELLFRSGLQQLVVKLLKNPWLGIVLTAFIFSLFHGEYTGFIPRFFLGILLGGIYWYTKSIWPCIIGHAAFNSLQIILMYNKIDTDNLDTKVDNVAYLFVPALVSFGILFFIFKVLQKVYQQHKSVTQEL